jgi:hypothetical protein
MQSLVSHLDPMGSSAVASWAALINALENLIEGPTDLTGNTHALPAVLTQYVALQQQPIRSRAMERVLMEGKVSVVPHCSVSVSGQPTAQGDK